MIGYVTLGTDDLERARSFYDALFETIGAKRLMQLEEDRGFTLYGKDLTRPSVVIMRPFNCEAASPGNGTMVALAMRSKEQVDAFHAKALELGASDEGAPGYRGDPSRGNYFAYFRDLDGHKFAAFTMAPQG
jgi:catechol 2,3-dioxygenase-like lactoylglutathione lyase family enzyme